MPLSDVNAPGIILAQGKVLTYLHCHYHYYYMFFLSKQSVFYGPFTCVYLTSDTFIKLVISSLRIKPEGNKVQLNRIE